MFISSELFAEVGDIKRASIHYDRSGRLKGTAEVVFSRRRDAEMTIKKYDNVQLDGKDSITVQVLAAKRATGFNYSTIQLQQYSITAEFNYSTIQFLALQPTKQALNVWCRISIGCLRCFSGGWDDMDNLSWDGSGLNYETDDFTVKNKELLVNNLMTERRWRK
ncbi:hypothetical protein LXL04_027925 [Taraxacum kok-saghyz]